MEKRASNTFVGGLVTDRHPLTAQNTELIEAQNIDLLAVGEGYQLVLQKREGNAQLMYDDENLGLINAGLDDTHIPLAVKEFNNIAYIVSVDPTTDPPTLELGTFPSPDYTLFEFVTGADITNGATVGAGEWEPEADSYEYAFTLDSTGYSGVDIEIDGSIGWPTGNPDFVIETSPEVITTAGFRITNTGALQDTYYITVAVPTGASAPEIRVDGSAATEATLNTGESALITFYVINPYQDTPINVYELVATVDPLNGSDASIKTYTFHYHTSIAFMVKRSNATSQWWTPSAPPPAIDMYATWVNDNAGLDDTIASPSLTMFYDWQSNYSTITSSNITFEVWFQNPAAPPVWITGETWGTTQLKVTIDANVGVDPRTAACRLLYGTLDCEFAYTQLAP
jgi:hypothetical protein